MKKKVELPLIEPVYSTYHYQGSGSAILKDNPSIRNWFLNEKMLLSCDKGFLEDITTTPDITVDGTSYKDNPYLEKIRFPMKYLNGYIHPVIRNLIDEGYYVVFGGVDDYYVKGKSWYHKRHFNHDGLICGYDQNAKTYRIYAYDQSWRYRVFQTTQRSFDEGRKAQFQKQSYGSIYALKPTKENVELSPFAVYDRIKEYLGYHSTEYTPRKDGRAYGAHVQDFIRLYIEKLDNGDIPYERIDCRVFRMLWEHKKIMLERLLAVECAAKLDHQVSLLYNHLVNLANNMRLLYSFYLLKRKDSILSEIRNQLYEIRTSEANLLIMFLLKLEKERVV